MFKTKTIADAPMFYSPEEARGWANGYNKCLDELQKRVHEAAQPEDASDDTVPESFIKCTPVQQLMTVNLVLGAIIDDIDTTRTVAGEWVHGILKNMLARVKCIQQNVQRPQMIVVEEGLTEESMQKLEAEGLVKFGTVKEPGDAVISMTPTEEPPCGKACPRDEHCDNYGIDDEPCKNAPVDAQKDVADAGKFLKSLMVREYDRKEYYAAVETLIAAATVQPAPMSTVLAAVNTLQHEYDTSVGWYKIDQNPADMDIEWIRANAVHEQPNEKVQAALDILRKACNKIVPAHSHLRVIPAKLGWNADQASGWYAALDTVEGKRNTEELKANADNQCSTTDILVGAFTDTLKAKLNAADAKYGYADAWMHCDVNGLRLDMYRHLQKGDPRDVAGYCAMLWARDASTALPADQEVPDAAEVK